MGTLLILHRLCAKLRLRRRAGNTIELRSRGCCLGHCLRPLRWLRAFMGLRCGSNQAECQREVLESGLPCFAESTSQCLVAVSQISRRLSISQEASCPSFASTLRERQTPYPDPTVPFPSLNPKPRRCKHRMVATRPGS